MFDRKPQELMLELRAAEIIDDEGVQDITDFIEEYPLARMHWTAGGLFAVGVPVAMFEETVTFGLGLFCIPLPGIAIALAYAADCEAHKTYNLARRLFRLEVKEEAYDLYKFRWSIFGAAVPTGSLGYLGLHYAYMYKSLDGRPDAQNFVKYIGLVNYVEFEQNMKELADKIPEFHPEDHAWFQKLLDLGLRKFYSSLKFRNGERKKSWDEKKKTLEKKVFGIETDIELDGFDRLVYGREIFNSTIY
ncbi:MAG: hypothetical protein ABIJ34_02450 [archaeon]